MGVNGVQSDKADAVISYDKLNALLKAIKVDVLGPVAARADQIQKELDSGVQKPFTQMVLANVGDGQAMGQAPISFVREILALVSWPPLLDDPRFASDVKARARAVLDACYGGSAGSYTNGKGIEMIRRQIAAFIERRDGAPSNWEDIVLSDGASNAIKGLLRLLIPDEGGRKSGVMVPIPTFHLYSNSLAEFGLHSINYYLDEERGWSLEISELERSLTDARTQCNPRALVVINPGNPTGQVLPRQNIEEIIKFAHRESLFLIADEVYQENVYAEGSRFHSFKKVTQEMGPPFSEMPLASFMSCSKGFMGECGLRGGYCETVNLEPRVRSLAQVMMTPYTCPTALGQTVTYCAVNPPRPGEDSHETFQRERADILASLAHRAKMVAEAFNDIPGMSCNSVQGAMYAFPQVKLPPKAVAKAESLGMTADVFYCTQLLERTGICVVPGTGFGQKPGTNHFRTTILPQPGQLADMLDRLRDFHAIFTAEFE